MHVGGREIGGVRLDANGGVEARDLARRGDGLGQRLGGIGFVEEHLTLQIAGFDVIAIDDTQIADTGPR